MKSKASLIILLVITMCFYGMSTVIQGMSVGVDEVITAYSGFQDALEMNNEMHQQRVINNEATIITLTNERDELQLKVDTLVEELNELLMKENGLAVDNLTGELLYERLVQAASMNDVQVERFYNYENGCYMTSLTGTLANINNTLQGLKESLNPWSTEIGNFSLRQNYEIYELARTYDDTIKMEWYNDKIINADGKVISLSEAESMKPDDYEDTEDPEPSNPSNTDDTNDKNTGSKEPVFNKTLEDYTKDIKIDEARMNLELNEIDVRYEADYQFEKDMYDIRCSTYDHLPTEEYNAECAKLLENYNEAVKELDEQKQAEKDAVKAKYQEEYDKAMAEAEAKYNKDKEAALKEQSNKEAAAKEKADREATAKEQAAREQKAQEEAERQAQYERDTTLIADEEIIYIVDLTILC